MTAALARPELGTTVLELRSRLAAITDAPTVEVRALETGIATLDAVLARGGVPCGRLTELIGARGSGKTTVLRHCVRATVRRGLWVAYVDAARTLAPRDWASAAASRDAEPVLWMIRPERAARAAWCAELLLRSGAFALVVLDGAPPLTSRAAVRLARLAREGGAAFIVAAEDDASAATLGGALRLRVAREARAVKVTVEKGGRRRTVEVDHARTVAHRVCAHPEVPDRRGVARPRAKSDGERNATARAAAVVAPVRRGRAARAAAAVG
jgi:hypothetical protein